MTDESKPPAPAARSAWNWRSLVWISLGIIITTFSQAFFLIPNKIVPGGFVGLGTVLYYYVGLPIGLFTICVNVILVFFQARYIGLSSTGKTVGAIVVQGLLLDLCTTVLHVQPLATDLLLASLYGGLLTGVGIAFIFRGGGTLGGTDIIAQLLMRYKHVPASTTFLWTDTAVLVVAGLVYGPPRALYALIKAYVVSQTVDYFMEGSSVYRQVVIISKQAEVISWGIIEEMHRGVTVLTGRGAYSNRPVEVLLTAVRRREVPELEELVYHLDPNAFIIVTDARRVMGRGFENLERVVDLATAGGSSQEPPAPESSGGGAPRQADSAIVAPPDTHTSGVQSLAPAGGSSPPGNPSAAPVH